MIDKERLKLSRQTKKLTQEDMSKLLEISIGNYRNYEQGLNNPSLGVLIKIADILDVSIDYLLGRSDK